MVVVSVPKDLDRVKKSLEWFWTVHRLFVGLCNVVLFPWVNNMLIMVWWPLQDEWSDWILAHVS